MKSEVLIIGAGLTGLLLAYKLKKNREYVLRLLKLEIGLEEEFIVYNHKMLLLLKWEPHG
ncbi:hypothetical protein ACWGOQ_0020820 [Aquimarina sp. M1]